MGVLALLFIDLKKTICFMRSLSGMEAAEVNQRINAANRQASAGSQQAASYLNAAGAYADKLATFGIAVPAAPPFIYIPPFSMRLEVDEERIKSQGTYTLSLTGQSGSTN
jgi:hypothetical protein